VIDGESLTLTTRALQAADAGVVPADAPGPDAGLGSEPFEPDAGAPSGSSEVDAGLACVHRAPTLRLSSSTGSAAAGTTQRYELEVSNPSDPSCPVDTFLVAGGSLPSGLGLATSSQSLALAPGETGLLTITVTVADLTDPSTFLLRYLSVNTADPAVILATAEASLVVTAAESVVRNGCPTVPNQPVASGGYYVNGNTICTAAGRPHLFHGVNRPSLEWVSTGENLSLADFELMRSWNANVVRIGLNQDFWLAGSALYDPDYPSRVEDVVGWAEAAGLDVILELHWSDAGVLGGCLPETGCQQLMPDVNSLQFWAELATRFRGDGRVLFELYNEPHQVSFAIWKNGGTTREGWQAVGMQELYAAVRATGAENLVIIGGLDWAYDLSVVGSQRIDGYNIAYATHPYSDPVNPGRPPQDWGRAWAWLTRTDPVLVTEFGKLNDATCSTDYGAQVLQHADAYFASWLGWAWYPGGCQFPSLIEDWQGTPSPSGQLVRAALLRYDDPPAALVP